MFIGSWLLLRGFDNSWKTRVLSQSAISLSQYCAKLKLYKGHAFIVSTLHVCVGCKNQMYNLD